MEMLDAAVQADAKVNGCSLPNSQNLSWDSPGFSNGDVHGGFRGDIDEYGDISGIKWLMNRIFMGLFMGEEGHRALAHRIVSRSSLQLDPGCCPVHTGLGPSFAGSLVESFNPFLFESQH